MSTALTRIDGNTIQMSRYDQREIIDTIKQTVAKGASDAQLKMFIEVCKRTGLDPFLKEIWFVAEKGIIMAGRDGYLRVANENPSFDGMETRVERDEKHVPIKAVCTVWRKDRTHPVICEAYFNEYRKSSPVWSQYPSAMISKVAEVLALKRSFAINGVVSEEEIGAGEGTKEAAKAMAEQKLAAMREGKSYEQVSAEVAAQIEAPPVTNQEDEAREALVGKIREAMLSVGADKMTKAAQAKLIEDAFGCKWKDVPHLPVEKLEEGLERLKPSKLEQTLKVPEGFPEPFTVSGFIDACAILKDRLTDALGDEAGKAEYSKVLIGSGAMSGKSNDKSLMHPGPALRAYAAMHEITVTAENMAAKRLEQNK